MNDDGPFVLPLIRLLTMPFGVGWAAIRYTSQVIAAMNAIPYKEDSAASDSFMRLIVPIVLLVVAVIHALPLIGVLGASQLSRLYGLPVSEEALELMLRHRAVLFGLLASFLGYAAFKPGLHALALIAAGVSVSSFLALSVLTGPHNPAIATIVRVDGMALVLVLVAAVAHLRKD